MPSPRRRSRDRRSRSRSRHRRSPPRRSRSRSPRRRSRSPRRSRTHSPHRRPIRRSRSRTRRSFSPRRRRSPSPKGHPRRPPPPRRRSSGRRSPGRRSLSPRGGFSQRRSHSPRGRPQGRRSPRRSPKKLSSGQRQSPHSSTDAKRLKSRSPYKELSSIRRESPPHDYNPRSPSPQRSPRVHHKNDLLIAGITVNAPIKRLMLTDRFQTQEQRDQGDIVIEDNIVIAIQRGLNVVNSSPVEINREFDPDNVVIIRRKDEGKTPIFDREEIKIFGFDSMEDDSAIEERRIISVIPQSRRHHSPEVIRKVKPKQKVQLDFRPDPKYEPLIKYRGIKDGDEEEDTFRIKRVQKNPNDLRHSLSKRRHDQDDEGDRFDARKKIDARRRSDTGQKEGDRVFARLGDRSKERKRDRSRERRPDRSTSGRRRDSRSSRDRKDRGDGKNLPDFKNRPDKFRYEEWKEKPEMIPRNPSYFEHDNREGERGFRGRGRGFRGRPPPRGSYRGRGGFRGGFGGGRGGSSLREREWKHDLFDKLKDEEEEKPSSTTKN